MVLLLLQVLLWTVLMGALVLGPAGTLAYPGGWAFIGLFGVGGLAITVWLARHSPRLLRERMSSPIQREQKPWDRVFLLVLMLGWCGWMALMGWDAARNGFSAVPAWLQVVGGICVVLYGLGVWLTFRENAFAAPVVKVQADQRAIDSGPYALVRHPMYASSLLMAVGLPLLLGSWLGLALAPLFVLGIAWRAVQEERTLCQELGGYREYTLRVRFRFVPHVW
jgi:protein-S-isoprenylcysteine O-methyltransferase Ste14